MKMKCLKASDQGPEHTAPTTVQKWNIAKLPSQLRPMAQVDFPYGKKRNWELDTADADIGLKSIPER